MPKLNWSMRKMEVSGGNGVKRQSWEAFQGTWKGRKNATVQVLLESGGNRNMMNQFCRTIPAIYSFFKSCPSQPGSLSRVKKTLHDHIIHGMLEPMASVGESLLFPAPKPRSGGTKILRVVKCIWHVAPKFQRARALLLFLLLNFAKAFANFA
ncbi:hypothetical protein D5086_009645 [Populus alba]|uniref:Uncharacterized protein n=1 Tax=Populus alba TaxID=43335 RepID=A0ACC4C7U5_POPAL